MEGLAIPGVRQFQPGEDFDSWVKAVERYMIAMNIQTPERKCALLLHLVGEDIADTYETLAEVEGTDEFVKCKTKLSNYLSPTRNVIAERMAFQKIKMDEGEEFEAYLTRLKKQVRKCGYGTGEEDRELRDRCVAGATRELQQKFLLKAAEKGDALTLEDVRHMAKVHKAVHDLGRQFTGEEKRAKEEVESKDNQEEVDAIQARRNKKAQEGHPQKWCGAGEGDRAAGGNGMKRYVKPEGERKEGRNCYNCGRYGHMARYCRAPQGGHQRERGGHQGGHRGGHQRAGPVRTCFSCGMAGHIQRWCPKRTAGQVIPEVLMALEVGTEGEEVNHEERLADVEMVKKWNPEDASEEEEERDEDDGKVERGEDDEVGRDEDDEKVERDEDDEEVGRDDDDEEVGRDENDEEVGRDEDDEDVKRDEDDEDAENAVEDDVENGEDAVEDAEDDVVMKEDGEDETAGSMLDEDRCDSIESREKKQAEVDESGQGEEVKNAMKKTDEHEVLAVQEKLKDKPPMVKVGVNGKEIEMLIDTGSPVSILDRREANQVPGLKVRQTNLKLRSFTGQELKVIGEATVTVQHAGQEKQARVIVCDQPSRMPLLGREWLREIQVDWKNVWSIQQQNPLTLETVLARNKKVFEDGLGEMTVEAHLTLKPGAVPKSVPARTIPYALLPKVNEELDRWVKEGIAQKIETSEKTSGWGTPLVPVPKPTGEVRLCASYDVTVNPQLVVKQHPLPRAEDVFAGVNGNVFCKLDLKNAYQQMKLDKESQDMTTVSTHRGLYRMCRLPFGIASCGALFQDAMERILGEQEGCKVYLDDVLVHGKDEKELLERLDGTLRKLKEHGLRLSREKCQFMKEEVLYLGWKISGQGIRPKDKGVEAVLNAPEPSDVQQLRSLLGSINYFAKLLPDLSTVLEPLYALTKKGAVWKWTRECREAVRAVKKMLAGPRVLMTYDPDLPVKLITDASSVGVGAALLHVLPDGTERPVAYASRSLTTTERKYAQVEKEAAAVAYGVSRFHHFLYGRKFTLVTDNRALSRILGPTKGLPSLAAARLQRYALLLATYSYSVELRKSEDMHVADSLSRMSVPCSKEEEREINEEGVVGCHVMYMDGTSQLITVQRVARETKRDPVLGRVLNYVRHGWPEETENDMRAYKQRQDELSTDFDCVLWGGRTVIPAKLRSAVLQELHQSHLGAAKMKNLARRYVWWPGLDAEIEGTARDCKACTEKKTAPPRATLHPWEPASQPWERVHIDYAGPFQGTYLLIVYDSYSRWVEVSPVKETTTVRTVHELRDMCARFGVPAQIVSDNGPQFVSKEFAEFVENNGIKHIRVAPYHQSSNGAAERAVQTVKNALKTSARDGGTLASRLQRFLLAYRVAPHQTTGRSPAELMLGRQPRTRLDMLQPDLLRRVKDAQQNDAERHPGKNRSLQVDDGVWARCFTGKDKWRLGRIRAATGPRSFEVDMGDGVTWSRHADQLWPADSRRVSKPPADTASSPQTTPWPPIRSTTTAHQASPQVREQLSTRESTAGSDVELPTERGFCIPTPREPSPEPGVETDATSTRMPSHELTTPSPSSELPIALRRARRPIVVPHRYRSVE